MKSPIVRFTAKVLLIVMAGQLILPATRSFALTTGPSQPEVQSFEPVGTTQMVDLFSGDFTYNIPLMDIEGYPVNIAYHSGANIEQEASWVGLGWNINPGDIGRNVRGVPDDFNGDTLSKRLNIKEEDNYSFRAGITFGAEIFGFAKVGLPVGLTVAYNNYRGMGINIDASTNLSVPAVGAQIGMGVTIGSQSGATVDIDASVQASYATDRDVDETSGSISLSGSTGFNTRSGLKNVGLSTSMSNQQPISGSPVGEGFSTSTSIPIGMQNYVSVITNASTLVTGAYEVKLGSEILGGFPNVSGTLSLSNLTYDANGSRGAYGYLYAQNANASSIMDFSREKDGMYNNSLPNLPLSSMTYDVYSISGQGTAGMYRPFRNDIGSIFDPATSTIGNGSSLNFEAGFGALFEAGSNVSYTTTNSKSGPWYQKSFKSKVTGSLFENAYFKQAGEMTYSLQQDNAVVSSHNPVMAVQNGNATNFRGNGGSNQGTIPDYYGGTLSNRASRANLLSFLTNGEDTIKAIGSMPQIESYPWNTFINANNTASVTVTKTNRIGSKINNAKAYHIGEMTQVLPDGRRYVYGIPAMNNLQKEVTFAVANANANIRSGLVNFSPTDNSSANSEPTDHYYQATYTPSYAHSFLLTQVLSPDYTDITGDGLSEDDLGSYTKFNYTRTDTDYRWVAPIQAGGYTAAGDSAQYNPGFWSDNRDDKANLTIGSRESWYVHSIESKNMVAEFYTSKRNDGLGSKKAIINSGDVSTGSYDGNYGLVKQANSNSYKLDSIKLYNKHDRILNGSSAIPIKTVIFKYDYLLCPGVPNYLAGQDPTMTSSDSLTGKLTLRRIYFRYGNSDKSLMNPYEFNYDGPNLPYNFSAKDRWGNFKPVDTGLTNYEFPYVKQNKTEATTNASAWQLTGIKLPSGGKLSIQYESDDYSYVQDKRTMEMFKIAGIGDGPAYNPRSVLYENTDKAYNYIYFLRDTTREIKGRSLKANYLENDGLLHFTFDVDLSGKNKYEHINGYAKVLDVGYCNSDPNSPYGYVKVSLESAGDKANTMISPVTLAALNTGRYYLPQIIYPGYNDGNSSAASSILSGLMGAVKELTSITQNANLRFIKQSLAKQFKPTKSWIRLNTPGYTKIGGGNRVKQLTLNDGWSSMNTTGASANYGQNYDYTTLLDNNTIISSGVASYEPIIGADEIPQHQPVKYTADAGRLLPAIQFFQEEPFGESFYPGASVGYSKVTVTSINKSIGRSSKGKNVSEFYTAKDFPIETDFTDKEVPVNHKQYGLTSRSEEVNVLQGYSVIMNDMHGKPKTVANYVTKSNAGGGETDELITSTKYNYQTQNGKLYNTVKAVKRNQLVRPTYSIANMVLGEEADLSIDNRMKNMDSKTIGVALNVNAIQFLLAVIPVPSIFLNATEETTTFKSQVATKVIQQYGILKSTEVIDQGARTITENELWDSETGQVILTTVNNEYNDPINNLTLPAYWAYDNMGPASFNTGYEEVLDSVYVDPGGNGYLLNLVDKRQLNIGDELLIKMNTGGVLTNYKVWITGMASPPALPTALVTFNTNPCDSTFVPVFQPRALYPSGDGVTPWIPTTQGYRNVYFKVLRAGRRNLLNKTVGNVAFLGTGSYMPSTFSSLLSDVPGRVISSNASSYTDAAVNDFTTAASYGLNNFILGKNGNYREYGTYAYKTERAYGHHARSNGYDSTFVNAWSPFTDSRPCSLADVVLGTSTVWNALKTVTQYNAYGQPVEELDDAGIWSSVLYGFNHSLAVATGENISANRMRYFGFEDLLEVQQKNRDILGIYEILNPNVLPTNYKYHNGLTYGVPSATDYGTNTSINSTFSHSGNYSMLFTSAGKFKLANVADYQTISSINGQSLGVPYCYVSMWVKPPTGTAISTSNMFIEGYGTNANPTTTQDFTAFTVKTNSIDGWYKLEGKIQMSLLSNYLGIYLSMPALYYVDDIRFYPNDGNMKSFAYDLSTMRLMAVLDENNFATFYEYDQEGVLVRVKKESDRGILTVSENRKSNSKNIQ